MDESAVIDLSGCWEFQTDEFGTGIIEDSPLKHSIMLPASMDQAGFGTPVTDVTKWHLNRKVEYTGPAWYRRKVMIPESWRGRQIQLFLERCHWESSVWVDGIKIGMCESLCTPHCYDLTNVLEPGVHSIAVRVDNSIKYDVGQLAHSITDHTQTNWNGIIGKIELRAYDSVRICGIHVYPDVAQKKITVKACVKSVLSQTSHVCLSLRINPVGTNKKSNISPAWSEFELEGNAETTVEILCGMEETIQMWDEFQPALYQAGIKLEAESSAGFSYQLETVAFGVRVLGGSRDGFTMNGRRAFLRGTLDCCVFPLTGYPSMQLGDWLARIGAAKRYGFNHIRFHSWCPPQAAFEAGDILGMIFQIETPVWTTLGDDSEVDRFITEEGKRILDEYGNHPSFCMMAVGNEPSGANKEKFLADIVQKWKNEDARRLYTGCSGWPELPENDYQVLKNRPAALRCQDWAEELSGRLNSKPYDTDCDYETLIEDGWVPIVSHEVGQWCAYPDFKEIKKYTGVLKPSNLEMFEQSLKEKGMSHLANSFLNASGRMQLAEYKADIETALRTRRFGGFQLLGLTDFSGQGTALVGVLNAFCESKGYTDEAEFKNFCCETVPLARISKIVWTSEEIFEAVVEVAHFGSKPMKNATFSWSLRYENGDTAACGYFTAKEVPVNNGIFIGRISAPLQQVKTPAKLQLAVSIETTDYRNYWDIWVYDKELPIKKPGDICVCNTLEDAKSLLKKGNKVLFLPNADAFANEMPSGFTTLFWNYEFTGHQAPRTLGILCDPKHPCFADFPTDSYSTWQWFDLITRSKFMILNKENIEAEPIVRVIDDWNTNDSLGLVFEARVGEGKLLMCSIDLTNELEDRPVAHQLLFSILNYMGGTLFRPETNMTVETIECILNSKEDKNTKLFDYRELVHVD